MTTQVRGSQQIKPGSITATEVDASIVVANGTHPFTGPQSMGGFRLTNLLDPINPLEAATKQYVDAAVAAGGGGGVSGLTPGQILFGGATGAIAQSAGLFYDVATGNVGVGTTTPGIAGIHLSRAGRGEIRITNTAGAGDKTIGFYNGVNRESYIGPGAGGTATFYIMNRVVGAPLFLGTNDVQQLFMGADGFVNLQDSVNGFTGFLAARLTVTAGPTTGGGVLARTDADSSNVFGTALVGGTNNSTALAFLRMGVRHAGFRWNGTTVALIDATPNVFNPDLWTATPVVSWDVVTGYGNIPGRLAIGMTTAPSERLSIGSGGRIGFENGGTPIAIMGPPTWGGTPWFAIQNRALAESASNFALAQANDGTTVLNSAPNTTLHLRVGNTTFFRVMTGAAFSPNVFVGSTAGADVTTGGNNFFFGVDAGRGITTGSGNVILGKCSGFAAGLANNIVLANNAGTIGAQFDATNWSFAGAVNATSGFRVAGAATAGTVLRGNGTNFVGAALDAGDIATGTLPPARGGTGATAFTFATGALLYGASASAIAGLADVAAGAVLVSSGVGNAPAYSTTPTVTDLQTTGRLNLADGTAIAPAMGPTSSSNTGLWFPSIGTMAWSTAGVDRMRLDVGGITLAGVLGFGATTATPDAFFVREAANTIAMRNATSPQMFRIYNTYTSATQYERLRFGWVGNVLRIGTEVGSVSPNNRLLEIYGHGGIDFILMTGDTFEFTPWRMQALTGHFIAGTDNTYDIGASGANRPRDFYLARNATIGGLTAIGAANLAGTAFAVRYPTNPLIGFALGNSSGFPALVYNVKSKLSSDVAVYDLGTHAGQLRLDGSVLAWRYAGVGTAGNDITWILGLEVVAGAIRERGRSVALGDWTSVAYSSSNFTTSGGGTWTVDSADQITLAYMLVGKTMTVAFQLDNTSVSASGVVQLQIKIPGGFVAAKNVNAAGFFDNATGGGMTVGAVFVQAGATFVYLQVLPLGVATWNASANLTHVRGSIAFEIQ